MKPLFNALFHSVPSLHVEVIDYRMTSFMMELCDCPSPKRAYSRFQATFLQIVVMFTALIKPKQSPLI